MVSTFGLGGDLLSNFSYSGGLCSCHSTWDLITTITGDLALTKDDAENNRQRLLMWLMLPKGERLDPSLGCCIHDYFHQKMTGTIYRELELDMQVDLKGVFPDLKIRNIQVESISDITSGNRTIQCGITLGNDDLKFVANFEELVMINEDINSLLYYGGASAGSGV